VPTWLTLDLVLTEVLLFLDNAALYRDVRAGDDSFGRSVRAFLIAYAERLHPTNRVLLLQGLLHSVTVTTSSMLAVSHQLQALVEAPRSTTFTDATHVRLLIQLCDKLHRSNSLFKEKLQKLALECLVTLL
jgi:hypothetical protein